MRRAHPALETLPLGIAVLGLALNLVVATSMSETADEWSHTAYGAAILRGNPARTSWFDSKMPVSALNAIPKGVSRVLERLGASGALANTLGDFRAARYATIAATFALSLLVYLFSYELFGRAPALGSQVLFTISPTVIAHGTLATTDLYCALATVFFVYRLRKFLVAPGARNAALAALALSAAQLTKFAAIYLYLAVALCLASVWMYSRYRPEIVPRVALRQIGVLLLFTVAFSIAVLNIGFLFRGTLTPLARYQFRSATFQSLQSLPWVGRIPVPAPYAYLDGLDWISYHNANGLNFGNIVLLGEIRGRDFGGTRGFPLYYVVAYGLKEPIGHQGLLLIGLWWLVRRRSVGAFVGREWPLVATAAVMTVMLSLFSNTQVGIRHVLPVLAICAILSGAAFQAFAEPPRHKLRVVVILLGLWSSVSVATYYPRMIPYFSEFVPDRKMAYRFLGDSNLDWGQNEWVAEAFLKKHPDVSVNPSEPVTGRVLVSANLMAGVWPPKADYWVRKRGLQPVGHVGYSHLLFDVPPGK